VWYDTGNVSFMFFVCFVVGVNPMFLIMRVLCGLLLCDSTLIHNCAVTRPIHDVG